MHHRTTLFLSLVLFAGFVALTAQQPKTFKSRLAPASGDPTMNRSCLSLAALAAAAPLGIALVAGQQPPSAIYTAEQAAAGRAVYQASCASCHMLDLAGRNEAPQLAGGNFMNTW